MSFVGLCRRGYYRLREFLVLNHSLRHFDSADCAFAGLVFSPCVSGEVSSYDHFHLERLAFVSHCHHRVRNCDFPVRENVGGRVKEFGGYLVKHLSFERDSFRQHYVECGNPVGYYHHEISVSDAVNVAHFADIMARLAGKIEICLYDCFHGMMNWF